MFTIVSKMREEYSVMCRFVDYHLKIGVPKILIYFDGEEGKDYSDMFLQAYDPDRVTFMVLQGMDLPDMNGESKPTKVLQHFVHEQAQKLAATEWVLTLDADEFLLPSKDRISSLIKLVPPNVSSFQIPVAEATWGPDDQFGSPFGSTYFRTPFCPRGRGQAEKGYLRALLSVLAWLIYGRDGWLFPNNTAGHSLGRHFFRSSVKFDSIGAHNAWIGQLKVTRPSREFFGKKAMMQVAHFDAIGFERWVEKLRRRITREFQFNTRRAPRLFQFAEFEKAYVSYSKTNDDREIIALMKRYYRLNWFQFTFLRLIGCGFRADIFRDLDR